ncbi:hypothetical protein [Brachybacterium sacelli]|uniref:hypothetical protein n=1 Tax=Brachybacterium sacelli TaxID=173364 RepID=UPI00360C6354
MCTYLSSQGSSDIGRSRFTFSFVRYPGASFRHRRHRRKKVCWRPPSWPSQTDRDLPPDREVPRCRHRSPS